MAREVDGWMGIDRSEEVHLFELVLLGDFVLARFGSLAVQLFGGKFEVEKGFFKAGHCGLGGERELEGRWQDKWRRCWDWGGLLVKGKREVEWGGKGGG